MKKLSKSYWRTGWVIFANGAVILWYVTSPFREYHSQTQIFQALRTAQPPFSFWGAFFEDAWGPIFTVVMLAGILAEVRRSIISPVFNAVPFLVPLGWSIVDWVRKHGDYGGERALGIAFGGAFCALGLVSAVFYALAFARDNRTGPPGAGGPPLE